MINVPTATSARTPIVKRVSAQPRRFTARFARMTHSECSSGRCDRGFGNPGNEQVYPNDDERVTGDYWSHDKQCQNLYCKVDSCADKENLGEYCSEDSECLSGHYSRGISTQGTSRCIPNDGKGVTGDNCSHNDQCGSWLCDDFGCSAMENRGKSCLDG